MLNEQTIAVIGSGNIGRALIGGLLRNSGISPDRIRATRRTAGALESLAAEYPGIHVGTDNLEAVKGASVIVLGVKPQNFDQIAAEINGHLEDDALIISVLAGITTDAISTAFKTANPVIRSMPNTPVLVDMGATAIASGKTATSRHLDIAHEIFSAVGEVEVVSEYLMDAVTGLSGSGPAYIYMIIEALTDGGVKQGLARPIAHRLAAQTVLGAARLVIETGKHPAILRDEVTTPGGTAIAAIADLESHGLRTMLINAVAAATNRSKELARIAEE